MGNLCQSCAMPMDTPELYGTERDGSKSEKYCTYCYQKGEFSNPKETMEEMIESCVPHMVEAGFEEIAAREQLQQVIPTLERWK